MIICVGESLIDFVPMSGRVPAGSDSTSALPEYRPVAGGSPFNCSIAAARLGGRVGFLGTVSTDFFGDHIVSRLVDNRVDISFVNRVDKPTTLAFVRKSAAGIARYAFYTIEAADRALSNDFIPRVLPDEAIVQIGSISLIADPGGSAILELAERERGNRVIAFDPNVRDTVIADEDDYRDRVDRALRAATILKTSDEDLAWIYPGVPLRSVVDTVLDLGVSLVVVTRGENGSEAYSRSVEVVADAPEVDVSDTIGAGDSFLAAFLVWLDEKRVTRPQDVALLSASDLEQALAFASTAAAVTCTRVGADPPYRDELER